MRRKCEPPAEFQDRKRHWLHDTKRARVIMADWYVGNKGWAGFAHGGGDLPQIECEECGRSYEAAQCWWDTNYVYSWGLRYIAPLEIPPVPTTE